MKKLSLLIVFLVQFAVGFSQINLWQSTEKPYIPVSEDNYRIETSSNMKFDFNLVQFQSMVNQNSSEFVISLPISKTEFVDFKLSTNTTMSEELMTKFPTIRAFDGIALDGSNRMAKIDVNDNYFRAMIFQPGAPDLFIDPIEFTNLSQTKYVLYSKKELTRNDEFKCELQSTVDTEKPVDFSQPKGVQTCELRTYRVAIATTGEYAVYHGGTVASAMAAIVTTLNRVNGVYERDLAITMTLVGNNEDVVFTDPGSDPYQNGDVMQMLDANPTVLNDYIGSANYDIGHVFGKDSGGVAWLDCVCDNYYKGGGVTGSYAPVGDAFDIDYVSHEMGHQYGANHTFNSSCYGNRNNSTAMEPGSASTILGYAGVCDPNVQMHSDAYFHAISLYEIGTTVSSYYHNCPVKTPLNNVAPVINMATSTVTIPVNTPFVLWAEAEDADGDVLTYTFEQMDKDVATQPPADNSTKGPSFRSLEPTTKSYRYFPSIQNQLSNNFKWERLSSESRNYKFTVTVRDNSNGGGCTDSKDITFSTNKDMGPFLVTHPNTTGIVWQGQTTEMVTWDVANTTASPINCQNVKILLSTNGGIDFDVLIESTPNNGQVEVSVPNVSTSQALIMVLSENETFFDISDKMFKIEKGTSGINEEQLSSVKLYPNPSRGIVRIDLGNVEYIQGYTLVDVSGKIVKQSQEKIFSNQLIDISKIERGVYFFEAVVEGKRHTFKLIKE